jgi:hypothetical protein
LEKVRALRRGLPDEAGSLEVLQRAVKLRNEFVHFKEPYSCIGRFGLSPIEAQVQEAELIAVRAACWDVLANTCALHVPDLLQRLAAREVEHRC